MDDYREIILATYISSFVLMIIFIFNIFVADRINLYTIVTSFGLFVGATAIMVLVFVPKVTTNSCCYLFVCCIYSSIIEVIKKLSNIITQICTVLSCEEKLLYTCSYSPASMYSGFHLCYVSYMKHSTCSPWQLS